MHKQFYTRLILTDIFFDENYLCMRFAIFIHDRLNSRKKTMKKRTEKVFYWEKEAKSRAREREKIKKNKSSFFNS